MTKHNSETISLDPDRRYILMLWDYFVVPRSAFLSSLRSHHRDVEDGVKFLKYSCGFCLHRILFFFHMCVSWSLWYLNFSQLFDGFEHLNQIFSECLSFSLTIMTTLTILKFRTWTPGHLDLDHKHQLEHLEHPDHVNHPDHPDYLDKKINLRNLPNKSNILRIENLQKICLDQYNVK